MRRLLMILTLPVSGCGGATPGSLEAYCSRSAPAWERHVDALSVTADDRVAVTGQHVVALTDAACAR